MIDWRIVRIGLILLIATIVIQFTAGVLAGLRGEWMRMGLYFVGCILAAVFWTTILLAWKIDACFKRLEETIANKQCN